MARIAVLFLPLVCLADARADTFRYTADTPPPPTVDEPAPDAEAHFREDWRAAFVTACNQGSGRADMSDYCGCVADRVLGELGFSELLEGKQLDAVIEPAAAQCAAMERGRQIAL